MAVIKEYRCLAHGEFEATKPKCPHGCSERFVVREFRTPPSIQHNSTKVADQAIRGLAADYGLTDVSNKDGKSVMESLRRPKSAQDFAPRFIDVPHAAPGFSQDPNSKSPVIDPQAAIGGSTAQGENAAAAAFGTDAEGRVRIPAPRPAIDPKLVYRPSQMPSAPE